MKKFRSEIADQIADISRKFATKEGLSGFEALFGYFTIVHLSPVTLASSKWMPVITGEFNWPNELEKNTDDKLLREFHHEVGRYVEQSGITLPATVTLEESNPKENQQNGQLSDWIMGIMNGMALINPLIEDVLSIDDDDLREAEEILDESLLGLQLLVPGPETDKILEEIDSDRSEALKLVVDEFEEILNELTEVLTFFRFNYPVAG